MPPLAYSNTLQQIDYSKLVKCYSNKLPQYITVKCYCNMLLKSPKESLGFIANIQNMQEHTQSKFQC